MPDAIMRLMLIQFLVGGLLLGYAYVINDSTIGNMVVGAIVAAFFKDTSLALKDHTADKAIDRKIALAQNGVEETITKLPSKPVE